MLYFKLESNLRNLILKLQNNMLNYFLNLWISKDTVESSEILSVNKKNFTRWFMEIVKIILNVYYGAQ